MNNSALGGTWEELQKELFTPEEIAASNLRVALIGELIKARQERGISQKKLEELSGVKQPIIARMEKGTTNPQIDTILKVLARWGKRLQSSRSISEQRMKPSLNGLGFLFIGNYEKVRNNSLTYSGQ